MTLHNRPVVFQPSPGATDGTGMFERRSRLQRILVTPVRIRLLQAGVNF
ncbi:MAG: hypothetical protein OJF48_002783 [Afipia sp.]|nr:MAG: hypothetical protein OJF48_002783 [Afipia sp.]